MTDELLSHLFLSPVHNLMKMLRALIDPDPMNLAEIIKHAVEQVMLIHLYHSSLMSPHKDIGIIAADNAFCPDYIRDLIHHAFFIHPRREFHARGKTIAHPHIEERDPISEFAIVIQHRARFLSSPIVP